VRGREYGLCSGSDQPDLIFCFFFIKKKEEGLRGQERGKPGAAGFTKRYYPAQPIA